MISLSSVFDHKQHLPNTPRSRAPALAQVERSDLDTHSTVDVDSPHIASVPSDYKSQEIKTDTQRERMELEEEDKARQAQQKTQHKARETEHKVKDKASREKDEVEQEMMDKARQGERAAKEAKEKVKKAADVAQKNPGNPVIFGNALVLTALGIALGVDGWRRYQRGTFGWAAAGAWAGIIGAFAVGDYFVSRLGLQKYPPKN